jgi:hypothetical protein
MDHGDACRQARCLAGRGVRLPIHRAASAKKNEIKPWLIQSWCIPRHDDPAFVAAMEDVLEVYKRPLDPLQPVVCMDEQPKQLIGEIRDPLPLHPGQPRCHDYEYVRNGTANVFMFFAPLMCWRRAVVRKRRTCLDWAQEIRTLVDVDFPWAERIVLVMDNLNTHDTSSLYAAFPPVEARRLAEKLEIHHTPKHGSWLNMAETELSVLTRQATGGRIANITRLARQTRAWMHKRNRRRGTVDWRFTTDDARIKLKKLYPSFHVS